MHGHREDPAGAEFVVPLRSRRAKRAAVAQQLQHVVASAGLLFSGLQSLSSGAHGPELGLAVAGIATSGLLIATFVRTLRLQAPAHGRGHAHRVDWMEIWAAGVLLAEAAERWYTRHHFPGPQLTTAAATLGIGLFHDKVAARRERRRSLRLTPDHLFVGRNRFSHFTAKWDDIAAIAVTDREAIIRTKQGRRRRLNLADLENASEVREALQAARRRLEPAVS